MKRFTETNKWRDPWFRRLSPAAKLLWFYLIDNCDQVGLVDIDYQLLSSDLGMKITDKVLGELGGRIQAVSDVKIFLTKFIPFQYGELSTACPPHRNIIKSVEMHGLINSGLAYSYPSARVTATLQERKGMDKNGKEEEGEGGVGEGDKSKAKSQDDLIQYVTSVGLTENDGRWLWEKWQENGWSNGGKKIKDWRGTVRSWKLAGYFPSQKGSGQSKTNQVVLTPKRATQAEIDAELEERRQMSLMIGTRTEE